MKYAFACYGGSGSTWLKRRLERRYTGHYRPETYWLPWYFPQQQKSATKFDQQLDHRGYAARPSAASIAGFHRRTGYQCDERLTIEQNLLAYCHWMKGRPRKVTMFSRAPMFGFFSRNRDVIRDLICIVRHPVHQYISLTKPKRHFEFVANTGGVNAAASISFWIREWSLFAQDALESGGRIVRYEYAQSNARTLDAAPREIFNKWDSSRRNPGQLLPEFDEQLRAGVWEQYRAIYGSEWVIA